MLDRGNIQNLFHRTMTAGLELCQFFPVEKTTHRYTGTSAAGYVVVDNTIHNATSAEATAHVLHWLESKPPRPALNGSFAYAVFDNEQCAVRLITDPVGSIPLYYLTCTADRFICGIDGEQLSRHLPSIRFSIKAVTQMLAFGYNLSRKTLLEGIEEAPAASILTIDCYPSVDSPVCTSSERYWRYRQIGGIESEADYVTVLDKTWQQIGQRYRQYIENHWDRNVVIKLTAGGDSRLLLSTFLGCNRLIAATYGTRANWDMFIARAICRANTIPHYAYTLTGRESCDPEFRRILTRSIGLRTGGYIGTGSAGVLRALPEAGSLHLPGHTGDVISGSHVLPDDEHLVEHEQLLAALLSRHVWVFRNRLLGAGDSLARVFRDPSITTMPLESYLNENADGAGWGILQRWDVEFRQHRFILSDGAVLRNDGPVLLPYWDLDWLAIFQQCCIQLMADRRQYFSFLFGKYRNLGQDDNYWPINSKSVRVLLAGCRTLNGAKDAIPVGVGLARKIVERRLRNVRGPLWRYVDQVSLSETWKRVNDQPEIAKLIDEILTPEGKQMYAEHLRPIFLDTCELLADWLRIRG